MLRPSTYAYRLKPSPTKHYSPLLYTVYSDVFYFLPCLVALKKKKVHCNLLKSFQDSFNGSWPTVWKTQFQTVSTHSGGQLNTCLLAWARRVMTIWRGNEREWIVMDICPAFVEKPDPGLAMGTSSGLSKMREFLSTEFSEFWVSSIANLSNFSHTGLFASRIHPANQQSWLLLPHSPSMSAFSEAQASPQEFL